MFTASGQGMGVTNAHWAAAVLYIGLARFDQALHSAQATARIAEPYISVWVLPELVEAAVRVGDLDTAREALGRLLAATGPCDTDWSAGIAARARALVADEEEADELYGEAIHRLGRTQLRPELARAHLLYGEWLRRQGRRVDARAQLRCGVRPVRLHRHGGVRGAGPPRAAATGETVRKRTAEASASDELTPQEQQIALLVR